MKKNNVSYTALDTIRRHKLISLGILLAVGVSVSVSLIPPLVLEKIVNRLGAGEGVGFGIALAYFALTALSGLAGSAQEALLTVFGQKMTHAMRSRLSEKLLQTLPRPNSRRSSPEPSLRGSSGTSTRSRHCSRPASSVCSRTPAGSYPSSP